MQSGREGFTELPEIEIYGQQFTAFYRLDENAKIRKSGVYIRSNKSDVSLADLQKIFNQIRSSIESENGESEDIGVPNFEDATERTGSLFAWKNKSHILILQKIESPGRTEIEVSLSDIDYFTSNLGADTGAYLLPRIDTKSGELRILASTPSRREVDVESNGTSDLAVGVKSGPKELAVENEESDAATWPRILGVIAVLGVAIIFVRGFLRGRVS